MNAKNFFNKQEKEKIVQAIKDAEKETSGEIRVHLESRCKTEPLDRAVKIFQKLKMHRTELRNGTIIYLAVNDRKFAIFGDQGINEKVPENFWDDIRENMQRHFKQGAFVAGLTQGIEAIGRKLKTYFPYQSDDVNELSDEISMDD
ncbi:MAG: TPM domain-containing protein [Caldithrix sp.]|nr:TPM domain-containing protein [Caldithrix sp.]